MAAARRRELEEERAAFFRFPGNARRGLAVSFFRAYTSSHHDARRTRAPTRSNRRVTHPSAPPSRGDVSSRRNASRVAREVTPTALRPRRTACVSAVALSRTPPPAALSPRAPSAASRLGAPGARRLSRRRARANLPATRFPARPKRRASPRPRGKVAPRAAELYGRAPSAATTVTTETSKKTAFERRALREIQKSRNSTHPRDAKRGRA